MTFEAAAHDYARIERALIVLEASAQEQPSLAVLAQQVGLSPHHFQRIFQRWAGVSPKRFLQYLTKEHALQLLSDGASVQEASLQAGLSGPSRLHDLLVDYEAVSPGDARSGGRELQLGFDFGPSPFGLLLSVESPRGLALLSFVESPDEARARAEIACRFPHARVEPVSQRASFWAKEIFETQSEGPELRLHLRGTKFQLKVWQALLDVPDGSLTTYAALARAIGQPSAARAVGTAVGQNPVACLIPCHRVIRSVGTRGGYRWGGSRKAALIGLEQVRTRV